ncbi:MAG TPA: hypothetical protein VHN98_05260, partial [Acidimicrobiales bacterium]|nr:hypothetical protein [Acidimicrobiales bacterium]
PLPWTKMRQAYALLGLVKKWGPERVDAACARALDVDVEAVNVGLIGRMLERATENAPSAATPPAAVLTGRFARDPEHFATTTPKPRHQPPDRLADRAAEANVDDGFAVEGGVRTVGRAEPVAERDQSLLQLLHRGAVAAGAEGGLLDARSAARGRARRARGARRRGRGRRGRVRVR